MSSSRKAAALLPGIHPVMTMDIIAGMPSTSCPAFTNLHPAMSAVGEHVAKNSPCGGLVVSCHFQLYYARVHLL